ncbi:hypothetical protein Tco_0590862 [Tanacetum coccineum]
MYDRCDSLGTIPPDILCLIWLIIIFFLILIHKEDSFLVAPELPLFHTSSYLCSDDRRRTVGVESAELEAPREARRLANLSVSDGVRAPTEDRLGMGVEVDTNEIGRMRRSLRQRHCGRPREIVICSIGVTEFEMLKDGGG